MFTIVDELVKGEKKLFHSNCAFLKMAPKSVKIFLLTLLSLSTFTESKTTPIHSHKRENELNKERSSDGAFGSIRRGLAEHLDGEEHNSEFDHEAILGSRDAAEEYDNLSPEEAKRRLKLLAISKDVNKDGEIDKIELVEWILQSFKMLNKEDAEERHEESDANDDNYVSWSEYAEDYYGLTNEDDGTNEEKRMYSEDRELFLASDLDGDGQLSKDEYLAFTHPEEFNYTSAVLIRRMLNERDLDGDGFINLQEYYGDDAANKDKDWLLAEKDKFDNDYDLNGDGLLNDGEVLRWLAPDDRESAEQEAEHLLDNADMNSDGRLDMQEIVDHHDIFVGSEATDYGQHLQDAYLPKEEL